MIADKGTILENSNSMKRQCRNHVKDRGGRVRRGTYAYIMWRIITQSKKEKEREEREGDRQTCVAARPH